MKGKHYVQDDVCRAKGLLRPGCYNGWRACEQVKSTHALQSIRRRRFAAGIGAMTMSPFDTVCTVATMGELSGRFLVFVAFAAKPFLLGD